MVTPESYPVELLLSMLNTMARDQVLSSTPTCSPVLPRTPRSILTFSQMNCST